MRDKIALWEGLRVQSNGVIFYKDTQVPAPEVVVNGNRYVRHEVNGKMKAINVGKLVYALFSGDERAVSIDKKWSVTHVNGNNKDCNINNLKFRLNGANKLTYEEQKQIYMDYERGVPGKGYYSLGQKYGVNQFMVKYIVDKFRKEESGE